LQDRDVLSKTDSDRDLQIFPDVSLVSIGGQSIFDRGKDAILPLVAEIAEGKRRHKMVIGVGGGPRGRHTVCSPMRLGLPPGGPGWGRRVWSARALGWPTGGTGRLVGARGDPNAFLLTALPAPHGWMPMQRDPFWAPPLSSAAGIPPIAISVPPFHFWEPPPI